MSEVIVLQPGEIDESMLVPLWCRAQCRVLYPQLGIGEADAAILSHLRADFSAARQSEPLLYALRQAALTGIAREFLDAHPDGTLIDLGCGLDASLRLVDNGRCRMVYADTPEVIALRNRLIPPLWRETYLAADALDVGSLAGIDAPGGVLVLMAGLVCHLPEAAVSSLLSGLAGLFPGGEAAFDGLGGAARLFSSGMGVKSYLPGAAALSGLRGMRAVRALKSLPANFSTLPRGKRFKLCLLLGTGVLKLYSCRFDA